MLPQSAHSKETTVLKRRVEAAANQKVNAPSRLGVGPKVAPIKKQSHVSSVSKGKVSEATLETESAPDTGLALSNSSLDWVVGLLKNILLHRKVKRVLDDTLARRKAVTAEIAARKENRPSPDPLTDPGAVDRVCHELQQEQTLLGSKIAALQAMKLGSEEAASSRGR
jgi:hypothetical protein